MVGVVLLVALVVVLVVMMVVVKSGLSAGDAGGDDDVRGKSMRSLARSAYKLSLDMSADRLLQPVQMRVCEVDTSSLRPSLLQVCRAVFVQCLVASHHWGLMRGSVGVT